jgi:putative sugar O-methyltransferase
MSQLLEKISNKIFRRFGIPISSLITEFNLRNDPIYIENQDLDPFIDRRSKAPSLTLANAERIIDSYAKAKKDQRACDQAFSPSNEWLPIYSKSLNGLIAALNSKSPKELIAIVDNFWRLSCSDGLVGCPFDMKSLWTRQSEGRKRKLDYKYAYFVSDSIFRIRLWEALSGAQLSQVSLDRLASHDYGNPYGLHVQGKFLRAGCDYHLHYSDKLSSFIADNPSVTRPIVGELGGGFGGMAYYFSRDNATSCYIDFDLPEILVLAQAYLLTALDAREIVLYGEYAEIDAICSRRVALLPSFCMKDFHESSFDAFFNSYSLSEMDSHSVDVYVSEIARLLKEGSNFLSVNHSRDCLVSVFDYPYGNTGLEVQSAIPALWNAMRTGGGDEYEILASKA